MICVAGEALSESNTVIDFVYCSPALRCVQTAQNILRGEKRLLGMSQSSTSRGPTQDSLSGGGGLHVGSCRPSPASEELSAAVFVSPGMQQDGKLKMRVEPGLFEWTKWVSGTSLPAWIPPTELAAAHFSVDTTYR